VAAYGGHQGVMRWARERQCAWDAGTCKAHAAAEGGHLGWGWRWHRWWGEELSGIWTTTRSTREKRALETGTEFV